MFVKPKGNQPSAIFKDITHTIQDAIQGNPVVFGFKGDASGLTLGPNDPSAAEVQFLGDQFGIRWFTLRGLRPSHVMIEAKAAGQATTPIYFQLSVSPGKGTAGRTLGHEGDLDYRHPGNVRARMAVFWTPDFFGGADVRVMKRAEEMLAEHNLAIDIWPTRSRSPQTTLKMLPDRLIEREDYESVRVLLEGILSAAGRTNYLPVLFGQFRFPANGLTVSDTTVRHWIMPMCLIAPTVNADGVTLLHEAGHAAGLNHDKTSTDPKRRNFMHEADTRTTMMRWQIDKIAAALYCR